MSKSMLFVIIIDGSPNVVETIDNNEEIIAKYQYDDDFDYGSIIVSDLVLEMFHSNLNRLYCIEKVV